MANLRFPLGKIGTVSVDYHKCDTDAGKPSSGLNVGDLAWAVDTKELYVAVSTTLWSKVSYQAQATTFLTELVVEKDITIQGYGDGQLVLINALNTISAGADEARISSTDLSAGNTILRIATEGTGITAGGLVNVVPTTKIAIKINGTVYYLLATTLST